MGIDRDHEIALQLQRQYDQQQNNNNDNTNNRNNGNNNNAPPSNDPFFRSFNMNNGGSSSHFTFTMSDGNGNIRAFSNNNGIPQNMRNNGNNNGNDNGDDPFAAFNHPFFQQN